MEKKMQEKLRWCLKQTRGISIINQNDNLSNAYMKEADETLASMLSVKGKWKVITGYYACYNALYSILMKAGIKSEIHDCSINLMGLIGGFDNDDIDFITSLKKDRISVQYYLKDKEIDVDKVKDFVLKCKTILSENLGIITKRIKEELNEN